MVDLPFGLFRKDVIEYAARPYVGVINDEDAPSTKSPAGVEPIKQRYWEAVGAVDKDEVKRARVELR